MNAPARLKGVFSPVITPFGNDLQADASRLVRHCQWLLSHDVGLAVFGTNSEANSMSVGEKRVLLDALVDASVPGARLMPGTGCCALTDTVELTRHAVQRGAAGVLMLPPFYYKGVSDDGLFASYSEVIQRVGDQRLRIYLYHIPQVSQVPLSLDLIERLLKAYPDSIAGIKDSSGQWDNTLAMLQRFQPQGFDVFAGSESFLLATLRHGGAGCITATGNVNPGAIAALYRHWQDADADTRQQQLDAVRATFARHPMIPAMKAATAHFADDAVFANVRPPLVKLGAQPVAELMKALQALNFAMKGYEAMSHQRSAVIVGGGVMGADIAAFFYAGGWNAQVVEPSPARREVVHQTVLAAAQTMGIHQAVGSVDVLSELSEIRWDGVELMVECVSENLNVKQAIFQALDRMAPEHVALTSNSSGHPISAIGAGCSTQARMLGLHFFMPAHLVPAVEVIRSQHTDEAVAQRVSEVMRAVRKRPVQVKRDVPGFLANRIQHAMMREAIALVDEGFASAEDVDTAVRYGFGFRYIAAGPLLQKDLAGIDIHCAAAATIYPHLHNNTEPSPLMSGLVARGDYGVKGASRKGFYEWDEASIAREQQRYQVALGKALQILRDEEDAAGSSASGGKPGTD